ALEKVAAHVTAFAVAAALLAGAAWLAGLAFGKLPGDEIPVQAAGGYALWLALVGLFFGALAFALAQFFGRGAGAGIAGGLLIAGYVLNNYRTIPALTTMARVTPWAWTGDHLPLAGQYDWASLLPLPFLIVALFAAGVEGFARRDLGAVTALRGPGLPTFLLGLRGPIGRSFGERLPLALAWGAGIGFFGFLITTISDVMADEVAKSPNFAGVFQRMFPAFDVLSAAGFLQLMVQLFYIVAGFSAATMVSGWASDETSGRLELLLATPLDRARWALQSGLGVFAALAVMSAVMGVAIGVGAAVAGSEAVTPMIGTTTLGLYAAALAGVGFAAGGLIRTSIASEVVSAVVVGTYLIDLLVPALDLPAWVHSLALTAHMGQPMVGAWDPVGVVASLVLAFGGLALGAWGFTRRDVR
ncbi:MAG TPA: hypothetical protein VFN74_02500, partial [Chloroflexota bacterium]|nr:hypothetical protein [Chloroflexota bacterium]